MAGGDRKRTGDIDPPVFTGPVFNVESPNLQGPNGTLRGQATADRALDDIRRAVGGFAVSTSTADQIMRDMREGSALQRAIREANAGIGSFVANATSSSLLQQAKTATAGGAIAEARRLTGSFLDRVEPSTIAALSDPSVGSAVQKAARASIEAPFADAALRSSLFRLQDEFGERYARAMREITGIGSLGGVGARLASGSAEDLASTRGLLADVAARAAASRGASTTSAALRRAHAALPSRYREGGYSSPTLRCADAFLIGIEFRECPVSEERCRTGVPFIWWLVQLTRILRIVGVQLTLGSYH